MNDIITINQTTSSIEESLLVPTFEKLISGIDTFMSVCRIIFITVCITAIALTIISIIRKKASSTLCKVSIQIAVHSALLIAMLYLLPIINSIPSIISTSNGSPIESFITFVAIVFLMLIFLILGETINRSLLKILEQKVNIREDLKTTGEISLNENGKTD